MNCKNCNRTDDEYLWNLKKGNGRLSVHEILLSIGVSANLQITPECQLGQPLHLFNLPWPIVDRSMFLNRL